MGVCILGGGMYGLIGPLATLSGELQGGQGNYIVSPLSHISGDFQQWYLADLESPLGLIEGYLWTRNGASLEGAMPLLETPFAGALIGTSDRVALEAELPLIEGTLWGGGSLVGEFSIMEDSALTGTVPVYGSIEMDGPLITGRLTTGGELCLTSVTITGTFHAIVPSVGNFNNESELSKITGSFTGKVPIGGDLTGNLARVTGTLTGHPDVSSRISGVLTVLSGSFTGSTQISCELTGELNAPSGNLTGVISTVGNVGGSLVTLLPSSGMEDAEIYDYSVLRFIRGQIR